MPATRMVPALQLSLRAALAAALSYALAHALALDFPLYAMIAAVIVTDLQPAESQKLSLRRLSGTIIGCVLGALLSLLLPASPLTMALGIFLSMFLTQMLHSPQAARIAGYLTAIVLLEHAAEPWTYAFWRFVETVLGIGVAVLVSFVPKLIPPAEKEK